LQDPLSISQVDMNILINSEVEALVPIWTLVLRSVGSLSLKEVKVALASLVTARTVFKKNFLRGEEEISTGHLDLFLQRALLEIDHASVTDCASILKSSKSLSKSFEPPSQAVRQIQEQMLGKYKLNSECEPNTLGLIIENLPSGSFPSFQPQITELTAKITPFLNEFSPEQAINIIIGLSNSGSKVPFKFINPIEFVSIEDLKKIPRQALVQFSRIAIENDLVTENLTGQILGR